MSNGLTPEQHIEKAEKILSEVPNSYRHFADFEKELSAAAQAASAHVALAQYKKKYPPENGRPVVARGPRMSDPL